MQPMAMWVIGGVGLLLFSPLEHYTFAFTDLELEVAESLVSQSEAVGQIEELMNKVEKLKREAYHCQQKHASPSSITFKLRQQAGELRGKADKVKRGASECREKILSGEKTDCHVIIRWRNNVEISIEEAEAYANELDQEAVQQCNKISDQLENDKKAMERQQQTIEAGLKELDDWTNKNKEFQKEAVKTGINALTFGIASHLQKYKNSARAYQGWLTRYEKQMKEDGVPFEALQAKTTQAFAGYNRMNITASVGKILESGHDAKEYYDAFKAYVGEIALGIAKSNGYMREALNDPTIQKYLENDRPDVDLNLFLAETALGEIPGLKIPTEFASFIVEYSYNALGELESGKRIVQQYHLTDTELLAVSCLGNQIENTVEQLNQCRLGAATPQEVNKAQSAPPESEEKCLNQCPMVADTFGSRIRDRECIRRCLMGQF